MANRGISADIPELRRFMRNLRKIEPEVAKATNRRFRAAAGKVANDAAGRAPKRSGRLARSIKPSVSTRTGAAVRSPLPYAAIHEYGGRHRVHGKNVWVHQPARPYMNPAAIAGRGEFYREANEAVLDAARKAGFR